MRPIFTLFLLSLTLFASAQEGELDPNYGSDGKQINATSPPTVAARREHIFVLPDGSFVQVFSTSGANANFGLAKFMSDGAPDTDFGTNGITTTDFGAQEVPISVTVRGDGKIVVAGYKFSTGTDNSFAIARYTQDGALDPTFNGTGMLTFNFTTNDQAFSVITIGTSTFVAGTSNSNTEFAVAKLLDNGGFDLSFNTTGKRRTAVGTVAAINDLSYTTGDNKLTAVGYVQDASNVRRFGIVRYTSTGALDATFNGGAVLTTAVGTGGNDNAYSVIVQPSTGNILVGGSASNGTDLDFGLVRYNASGVLDNTFDGNGILVRDYGFNDVAYGLSLQVDGNIIAGGLSGSSPDNDFIIARFTNSGADDPTFNQAGTPGYNKFDFGPPATNDYGYDFGFQGTNILVAGASGVSLASARIINSSVALPFYLLNFSAVRQNASIALRWQTATEESSRKFEVLRSEDGKNFTRIADIAAAGNSSFTQSYSYLDAKPLSGVSYYRLKMVNINGTASYSRIVVVRSDATAELTAFPNPVRSVLNIQLNAPTGNVQIQLFDLSGRMLKNMSLRTTGGMFTTTLEMGGFTPGTYFLRMNNQTMKLIKQ